MADKLIELKGLVVTVDRVVYMPQLDAPDDQPHPFGYYITVRNDSPHRLIILNRKWMIYHNTGATEVFEGRGLVGQTPELGPGQIFSYNSYHVTSTGAEVSGAFFGETAAGDTFYVRVPVFRLEVPSGEKPVA